LIDVTLNKLKTMDQFQEGTQIREIQSKLSGM
jgi:hypothetical protein